VLTGLSLSTVALLLVAGVVLDLLLGETRRWHPLVGFGNLANFIERRLNRGNLRLPRGGLAWALAVLPLTALFVLLTGARADCPHRQPRHCQRQRVRPGQGERRVAS